MNVVQRENRFSLAANQRSHKNELVRRDACLGIRGISSVPTIKTFNSAAKIPRYQFGHDEMAIAKTKRNMGPPLEPPRSSKRKQMTLSSKPESSSISDTRARGRVLASDSAADTSADFCTPRNRPTALRYIGSSSRGGHSGTRSMRSTSTSVIEASVILAISEGRGMARGEIGIAAIDLRHPTLVLCQFSDTLLYTHTLTKINYFNPVEIIVPHTFCEGAQTNQLYQLIKDQFPTINLTTVQRRHFNDAAGRQQIQTLCHPQYSAVYLQALHKFYALTAAAAVLKYVEYIQCIVFARESLKIVFHSSENTMIIDVGTATQLELVQPLVPSAGPTCCLLGVLGPTYTVGGIRALRAAILQPSFNGEFIENRLDAVQDLIENDNGLMMGLQDVIKKLSEIDKILFLCVESPTQNMDRLGESQLNQTLLLKTTMDLVPKLVEALGYAESGRLRKMKMDFENPHYKEISDRIRTILHEDAHLEKGAMGSLQRCFAVKPDINGLLDVARRMYSELIEDIQKLVEQLSESYDLPIRLNQNVLKGFHVVMSLGPRNRRDFRTEDLPDIFIQVQNNGSSVSMTTEELVVMDRQAKEALNEIQKMSNIVVGGLLKELRPFMSSLYSLCENVAELDILLALAHASTVGSYIRPEFSNYLDVRNSVHPLLDYNSQTLPVPNDIYASPELNFTVVTGPNMGGKSIYIKQIAIMHIMAQIGCFLPATKAVLRLSDRVFSRIGFNDSVELNASTYVLEMKEIQHILKDLTKTSLVIIDELCRGTSTEEGTSIAWAICEELLASEAYTFFTTHFMYLTRLQDLYYNVINLHTLVTEEEIPNTQTSESQKRLIYQHKIEKGVTKVEHYGLALASKTNLPEETVKLAEELAELIVKTKKPQEIKSPKIQDEQILYNLNADIRKEARRSDNPDETTQRLLNEFKELNPELIQRLRNDNTSTETDRFIVVLNNNSNTDSNPIPNESSNILPSKSSNEDRPDQRYENVSSFGDNENGDDFNMDTIHEASNDINMDVTSVQTSNQLLNTILTNDTTSNNESCNGVRKLASDSEKTDKVKRKPKFRPPLRISDSNSSVNQTPKPFRPPLRISESNSSMNIESPKHTNVSLLQSPEPMKSQNSVYDLSPAHRENSATRFENYLKFLEDISLPSSSELQDKYAETTMLAINDASEQKTDIDKDLSDSSDEEIQRIFNNSPNNTHSEIPTDVNLNFNREDSIAKINLNTDDENMDTDSLPEVDLNFKRVNNKDVQMASQSDDDIAEALTQVLQDFDTKSRSSEVLASTVDEQLMEETANEIREALAVEDIALTPPEGFRD